MSAMLDGLLLVLDPYTMSVIVASSIFGLFIGAIPGLSATMATALLVPITFFMPPVPAIAAIISCTAMAISAGDIPAVLLRMPGTAASAAYTDESFAMGRKGLAGQALGILFFASALGGVAGFIALSLVAPTFARVALNFSSFEFVWLAILGLSSAALISSNDPIKGFLALTIGLLIATVGMDPLTGFSRFTFGWVELQAGVDFIAAMIGMFALAEVFRRWREERRSMLETESGNPYRGVLGITWKYRVPAARGSVLGILIGALPGAGGDIAAWISYAMSKRFSRTPEKFGTGHAEGLVEAGASNNSGLTASWIPAMVFGVPGDSITAIAVGVLYMKGMNPGPTLLTENPQNFYAVLIVFFIANMLMLPIGYAAIRSARFILSVPRPYLNGAILVVSLVGAFAISNTSTGIVMMIAFGVLAFVLEWLRFPIAPIILGVVLGTILEQNFIASMTVAGGNLLGFFERPIAAGLGVLTLVVWLIPLVRGAYRAVSGRR